MIAIILAAGRGTRLLPVTERTPKCLLPLGARPLLHRTLEALGQQQVEACTIVTGFCAPQIKKFAASLQLPYPVRFVQNEKFDETNNNYSLWMGMTGAHGHDILVMDADILFAGEILDRLLQHVSRDALVIRSVGTMGEEEIKIEKDEQGCVRRIGKEINPATVAGESIGVEKFCASTADRLLEILARRKDRNEFYEASFQQLIDQGVCLTAVDAGELPCMEVDTPEDYIAAYRMAVEFDGQVTP